MDGGGTKTKCVLTDENLRPLHECKGGPSTFLLQGTEKVSETLLNLILECVEKAKISVEAIEAVLIGTTGAGRRSDAERLEEGFTKYAKERGYSFKIFRVESDARIALEGSFSGKPGSILIAGTGSIMFGKDNSGNIHRVGGFGRFIGDQGSGYALGKQGLIAVSKAYDGRGEETVLTSKLKEQFGIADSAQLIIEIYKNGFDIASVSPLVVESAEEGDNICKIIVEEEVNELVLHIKAMKETLNEEKLLISPIGGTITTDNFYAKTFNNKVKELFSDVEIVEAEKEPALGAVLMAIDAAKN